MEKILHDTYTITSFSADMTQQASVVALCNFMQESAWKHAQMMGLGFDHLMDLDQAWVLSRFSLQFEDFPSWQEDIRLQTWSRGSRSLLALRDFLITDERGERNYVSATSSWLVIDLESRRPQRLKHIEEQMKNSIDRRATDEDAEKVPPLEEGKEMASFEVKYSDIDVNKHVNNVAYIKWIIDAFPIDFMEKNYISRLSVNFISEALPGDEVVLIFSSDPRLTETLSVSVREKNSGRVLCRSNFLFEKRKTV